MEMEMEMERECRSRRSLASKHSATSARGLAAWQPAMGGPADDAARPSPPPTALREVNAPRQTNHRRTRILIPRA
jgi:hypothetical protein